MVIVHSYVSLSEGRSTTGHKLLISQTDLTRSRASPRNEFGASASVKDCAEKNNSVTRSEHHPVRV